MKLVNTDDILAVLDLYWNNTQPVSELRNNEIIDEIQQKCEELMKQDYEIISVTIPSKCCLSYPKTIYIPIISKNCENCNKIKENKKEINSDDFFQPFVSSSNGRARGRFIAPVILIHLPIENEENQIPHSRYILRSGALIESPESFLRLTKRTEKIGLKRNDNSLKTIRMEDRKSMFQLGVGFVFDLMVEEKLSKLLGLLKCVSSEKAEIELYNSFDVLSMPFPGFEIFSRFNEFSKSKERLETETHHIHYPEVCLFIII